MAAVQPDMAKAVDVLSEKPDVPAEKPIDVALAAEKPNIIEQLDMEYLTNVSKLQLGNLTAKDQIDHVVMRKWLNEFVSELDTVPRTKRRRAEAEVSILDVPIIYNESEEFAIRVYTPIDLADSPTTPKPVIIMIHGGGWMLGVTKADDGPSKYFASELDAVVIGVNYRLCPEFPFPAAHNDCFETLNWVMHNAAENHYDTSRIALWGSSAGGQLAASITLRDCNENKISRIKHVNLVVPTTCAPDLYPPSMLTKHASTYSFPIDTTGDDPLKDYRKLWAIYAEDKIADPYASVLTATIPENHPSVHVSVGGRDGLRDEGIAYALALRNAGADVQLEIVPGVPHGINVSPIPTVAVQWYRDQTRALYNALHTDF